MIAGNRSTEGGLWTFSPKELRLNKKEIHVHCTLYSKLDPTSVDMMPLLSEEERSKADTYRFEKDRRHFILRHGLLRQLLAHYVQISPDQLVLEKSDYGKPLLKTGAEEKSIFFSMAHSFDVILYAFSRDLEIGIDVERAHAFPDMNDIIQRFFTSGERSEFAQLPEDKRVRAFFRGWTCKEAVLKAVGKGLSNGLDGFSVTLDPDKKAGVQDTDSPTIKASDWSLEISEPIPDYYSAVAIKFRNKKYVLKYLK